MEVTKEKWRGKNGNYFEKNPAPLSRFQVPNEGKCWRRGKVGGDMHTHTLAF